MVASVVLVKALGGGWLGLPTASQIDSVAAGSHAVASKNEGKRSIQ